MADSSAALLSLTQSRVAQPNPPRALAQTEDSSQRFSSTLTSALRAQAEVSKTPASAPAQTPANGDGDAAVRAQRALELGDPTAPTLATPGAGDVILSGITKLRGVFNNEISKLSSAKSGDFTSLEQLFQAQTQFANFSMLMEMSSKLAGKGTQTFETLLKGQ